MKHLLILALLCGLSLFSCSKKSGSDPDPQSGGGTTVTFENKLSRSFPKVLVGTYRETSAKLVKNYGTLAAGASTGAITINPEEDLVKVFFYYEEDDKVYYTSHGFLVDKGTKKTFDINSSIPFDRIEKTNFMYPK